MEQKHEQLVTVQGCKNSYSKILLESKNIIFRGAPGTGKSYLATAGCFSEHEFVDMIWLWR